MPRSKKNKVVTEGRGDGATPSPTGATATEETPSTIVAEEDEDPLDDLDNMTEAELRRWTKAQVQKLKGLHAQALVDVRKAEAELRHEERRAEEREKRWDAAEQSAQSHRPHTAVPADRTCIQVEGVAAGGAAEGRTRAAGGRRSRGVNV